MESVQNMQLLIITDKLTSRLINLYPFDTLSKEFLLNVKNYNESHECSTNCNKFVPPANS